MMNALAAICTDRWIIGSKNREMKKLEYVLLLLFLSPLTVFAHGQEVLETVFVEFVVMVIFVIGLLAIKLNVKGKLIIAAIYILTTVSTFVIINNLPYNQFRTTINIAVGIVPLTIGVLSYVGLRSKFQGD
jgi:hypothetical protein